MRTMFVPGRENGMFFCFLFVSRCSNIYNNGCTECAAQTCSRQRKTITTNMKINITADAMRQRNPPANPHSPITSKIRDRLIDLLRLTYVQNFHVTNVECLRSDEKKNENCGRCSRARSKSKVKVICVELEYFIAFICNSECICISFVFCCGCCCSRNFIFDVHRVSNMCRTRLETKPRSE